MSNFNFLIDTNIIIALEDAQPVREPFSELVRLSNEHGIGLFFDSANVDDVNRDTDTDRRAITLSKLDKFQKLRPIRVPPEAELIARYGNIKNDNDRSDVRLLNSLDAKAVHFLITQDAKLYKRAERSGLGLNVMTVKEALEWLRQTFQEKTVQLPYIFERKAYEIGLTDEIFTSLRSDYDGFDAWFDKCREQQRDCWVLEIDEQIAGLVIRNEESHSDAQTLHSGPKILKICTFKVRDEYRGEKFGELLLKQALWFAQHNDYDLVYLTVFPKHEFLIDLLSYYGFEITQEKENDEKVMEKVIAKGALACEEADVFSFDRRHYPRFYDAGSVRKFCVPIQAQYHKRLFPEIAMEKQLSLFSDDKLLIISGADRTPGNTIRKVYLCRAKIKRLRPGDVLFFYMSQGKGFENSQTVTTIGIVEQVVYAKSTEELIRLTAKRSVFSQNNLGAHEASEDNPMMVIDFLLIGHMDPPISLKTLTDTKVFNKRPPQSIAELSDERYKTLRPLIKIGFEI